MIFTLIALSILFVIYLFPKIKEKTAFKLVLYVPIINAIADVTTEYFLDNSKFKTGSIRAIILLLIVFPTVHYHRSNKITKLILFFLFYLGILICFSTNPDNSFFTYLKVLLSFLMFPLAYNFIDNIDKLKLFNKYFIIGTIIIVIQSLLSQVFNLGVSEYLDETFYMGGALVQITYSLVIFILISPMLFKLADSKKQYIILTFLVVATSIIIALTLRRISLVAIPVGFFIYYLYSPYKNKTLKYLMIFITILSASFPFWGYTFEERFIYRSESKPGLTEEARFLETFIVIDEIKENSIYYALFGTELFNSFEYFKKFSKYAYVFGAGRQLHVDYNIILNGAGIFGLILYILIFYKLWVGISNIQITNIFFKDLRAIYFALIVISFVISLSGSLDSIGYRGALMLYLGAIFRILQKTHSREFKNSNRY